MNNLIADTEYIKIMEDDKRIKTINDMVLHLIEIEYKLSKNTIMKGLIKDMVKLTIHKIFNKIENKKTYKKYQSISNLLLDIPLDSSQIEYNNYRNLIIKLILSLINDTIFDSDKLTDAEYVDKYNKMEKIY